MSRRGLWLSGGLFGAVGVGALLVAHLYGPSGGPGEEAVGHPHFDPPCGGKDGPLEVGAVDVRDQGARGEHPVPPFELADRPKEGLPADEDRIEGGRAPPVGRCGP